MKYNLRAITSINHRPIRHPAFHLLLRFTSNCLRHTFGDRLRAVECPMDMIDQIGGWRSVGGVGARYGEGYGLTQLTAWVRQMHI